MGHRSEFSAQTLAVLAELCATPSQWRHGYGIARDTGLKSGTLYPHFAHNAVRRHYGHAALDAAGAADVDVSHLGIRAGAGADHGRGQGLGRDVRLKHAERFGALRGVQLVLEENVIQLEAPHLVAQAAVFGVFVVQQDVVADELDAAAARSSTTRAKGVTAVTVHTRMMRTS